MSQRLVTALAIVATTATPAAPQEPGLDWDLVRQPEQSMTAAYVQLSSGLMIAFRCMDGGYGAIISGLPEARRSEDFRTLRLTMTGRPERETRWAVTRDRAAALAEFPASLARRFRQGGDVSLVVPGGAEGGRNLRYNITLPGSAVAIDETLTACGRPLVDPRDERLPDSVSDSLPDGLTWSRPPRPRHPLNTYSAGYAVVSCVVQPDGRVDDCEVESEFPLDGRYGRNALAAMPDARVVSPGETAGEYAPRMIGFRVNYRQ